MQKNSSYNSQERKSSLEDIEIEDLQNRIGEFQLPEDDSMLLSPD